MLKEKLSTHLSHSAIKWQNQDPNPGHSDPRAETR